MNLIFEGYNGGFGSIFNDHRPRSSKSCEQSVDLPKISILGRCIFLSFIFYATYTVTRPHDIHTRSR